MNIVLTCLNNFQDYILENIEQLVSLGHKNIYVIANSHMFDSFNVCRRHITLINADDLNTFAFESKTTLDSDFRDGFWRLTSQRFFVICEFMKTHDVKDVVHIENDVLVFYNCEVLSAFVDRNYVYMPFDTYTRNIASIMYIPSADIFQQILDHYDCDKNDMDNFSVIRNKTGLIKNFPIFPWSECECENDEMRFVCSNSDVFPWIFDAAAMGQYLGGVDSRNIPGDTRGFVNETCVIKYDIYEFEYCDGKPFLVMKNKDKKVPIFNLHIHSKNMRKFMTDTLFDIVIPLGPNDTFRLPTQLENTKKNVVGYRNIYIVVNTSKFSEECDLNGCTVVDESVFRYKDFIEGYFASHYGKSNRNGWYFQQLIKLHAGECIEGILDNYLVVDADVYFLKPTRFFENNKPCFGTGNEYHVPYFEHMKRMHTDFIKMHSESGICHHMMFNRGYMKEMVDLVEKQHNMPFWKVFIMCVKEHLNHNPTDPESGASEYEMYFNYMLKFHAKDMIVRRLNWRNINIREYEDCLKDQTLDYVSVCSWWMME